MHHNKKNDNNVYWESDDAQLNDWMEHIKFDSVCCWALSPNDCRKHQSNNNFPYFKSERLVAPLTTPPLMDLRILPLVLKCITINVIWDTQSMTCLPGDKHGQITALQQTVKGSVDQESIFFGKYYYSAGQSQQNVLWYKISMLLWW